jgi:hypothetical protein
MYAKDVGGLDVWVQLTGSIGAIKNVMFEVSHIRRAYRAIYSLNDFIGRIHLHEHTLKHTMPI